MVCPDLVASHFRPEPPAAEASTVTFVPKIEHRIEAVDLEVLFVDWFTVVLAAQAERAIDDCAHSSVGATGHLDGSGDASGTCLLLVLRLLLPLLLLVLLRLLMLLLLLLKPLLLLMMLLMG